VNSAIPPKTATFLGKIPNPQQEPIAAPDGGATGNTSSSPSESWNCAALGPYTRHSAGAVKGPVYAEGARFLTIKTAAMACEAALPRRIQDEQVVVALAASRIHGFPSLT